MKAYIAMNLVEEITTNLGIKVNFKVKNEVSGALLAFKTKKAARKWFGKNIELVEIGFEGKV